MRRLAFLLGVAALLTLPLAAAHGQSATSSNLLDFPDQVVTKFTDAAGGWIGQFQAYARNTFGLLAFLSVAWTVIRLAFRNVSVEEFIAEFINLCFFIGIGLFVLTNAPELMREVINSFRIAGRGASGAGLAPSQILTSGLQIAGQAWQQISAWDPASSGGLILVALVVVVGIAIIAGMMTLALVQVALFIPFATFCTAFLGSYWTRDIAFAVLRQSFALGAKLMMLELIAATFLQLIKDMMGVMTDFTATSAGVVIASVCILAFLTLRLPDWVAGVLGGASLGEGRAIVGAAAAAAGAAVATSLAAAGVAPLAVNAGRLASAQGTSAQGRAAIAAEARGEAAPQQSAIGQAGAMIGRTLGNMAGAAATDIGHRLGGQGSRHGSPTWRMSADLGNRARLLQDDNNTPSSNARAGASGSQSSGTAISALPAAEPWMTQSGGYSALSQRHQDSAQRSYAQWAQDNPEFAARHDLSSYVSYAQERQAERGNTPSPDHP